MIKTVKIKGTDNERIHNSELNEYSFSKTLVKHKSKIIEFLEDKYLEVFDKAHAIDSIDRKMIAKDYLISNSQLKYNEEFLNECEMFIDLFLVENYKKLHYKKALGKHTNTETKVLKPNFKTNVKERKKENMEREKLKCQMGEFTSKEKLQLANTIKTIDANCGYSKYKDAIVDEIEVFINEKNTKLKVLLPWTSAGKSHAVKQTIYNHFSNTGFKIIITTPNKCNLPSISEIVRALQDKGITVNASDIIMLDNVTGNITQKTKELNILKNNLIFFKGEAPKVVDAIDNLLTAIGNYNNNPNIKDRGIIEYFNDKVCEKDLQLRNSLKNLLTNDSYFASKIVDGNRIEKINSIFDIPELKILPQIYPQLSLYKAKVITMSAQKMLYPIDMLFFTHTNIIESDIINSNTIVVLDESDDIYGKWKTEILNKIYSREKDIDVFNFLRKIYSYIKENKGLNFPLVDKETLSEWNKDYYKPLKDTINNFVNKYDVLNHGFFKIKNNENSLIYTSNNHTFVSIGDQTSSEMIYNLDENINIISLDIKPELDENTGDKNAKELISAITECFGDVKNIFFDLTRKYYDYHEKKGVNIIRTRETALSSILQVFIGDNDASEKLAKKMVVELMNKSNTNNNEKPNDLMEAIEHANLSNGFGIYRFENKLSHEQTSILYGYHNQLSPELFLFKILLKCKKCICLSATGYLKSEKSNFNFDKIKIAREKYYANKNYNPIKEETPFQFSDDIIKYNQAAHQQSHTATKNVEVFYNYNNSKNIEDKNKLVNKIKTTLSKYKEQSTHNLFLYIENYYNGIDNNNEWFDFTRDMNQLYTILYSIKQNHRSLLIIRNTLYQDDKDGFLNICIKILNDDIFIQKKIASLSLKDLGTKYNNPEIDYEIEQREVEKVDGLLEKFYIEDHTDENTIIYVLFSSIPTVATGINLYQVIKENQIDLTSDSSDTTKRFYIKIPDFNRYNNDKKLKSPKYISQRGYIKADVDAIYLERKTHVLYNFLKHPEQRIDALYELNSVYLKENSIDEENFTTIANNILSKNNVNYNKWFANNTLATEAKYLLQGIGRKDRCIIGCKNNSIFIEDSNTKIDNIGKQGYLGILKLLESDKFSYCPTVSTIAKTSNITKIEEVLENNTRKTPDIITPEKPDFLKNLVCSNWDENDKNPRVKRNRELYEYLKDTHLLSKHITLSKEKHFLEKEKFFNKFHNNKPLCEMFDLLYIPNQKTETGYAYTINEYARENAKWLSDTNSYVCRSRLTKESLKLDIINSFLKNHNVDDKNLVHLDYNDDYIVNPILADFAKGDIAEYMYETFLNSRFLKAIHLSGKHLEYFDYITNNKNCFIDIKFWRTDTIQEYIDKKHIEYKLDQVSSDKNSRALLLNFFPNKSDSPYVTNNERIQVINVIDENGVLFDDVAEKIMKFIGE